VAVVGDEVRLGGQRGVAGVEGGARGADVVDQQRVDADPAAVGQGGLDGHVGGRDAGRGAEIGGDGGLVAELRADHRQEAVVTGDAGVAGGGGAVLIFAEDRDHDQQVVFPDLVVLGVLVVGVFGADRSGGAGAQHVGGGQLAAAAARPVVVPVVAGLEVMGRRIGAGRAVGGGEALLGGAVEIDREDQLVARGQVGLAAPGHRQGGVVADAVARAFPGRTHVAQGQGVQAADRVVPVELADGEQQLIFDPAVRVVAAVDQQLAVELEDHQGRQVAGEGIFVDGQVGGFFGATRGSEEAKGEEEGS
jgi:hypothetical protein